MICSTQPVQASIWAPFHTKTEMNNLFKSLCASHPTQASYVSIGKSVLEYDIWLFRFGNPNGSAVLWDGQMHGNEDYGSEILLLIAQWLFSGDSAAQRILENNYILMIPVVNIDVWGRYNAHDVNLNRNFETGWNKGAEHPGSSPYSEPETQALRNAFQDYNPDFYVNLHQGANGYFSYYSGGNRTLVSEVTNRAKQIASDLGMSPYRVHLMDGTGFAIGDAYSLANASSWLAEVDPEYVHTDVEWQRLVNTMYPKCLAMFIAMCETFTTAPSPPPSATPSPTPTSASAPTQTTSATPVLTPSSQSPSPIPTLSVKPTASPTPLPATSEMSIHDIIADGATFHIVTKCNSTISGFNFSKEEKKLLFNITGPTSTQGFCNITIPNQLLGGPFNIIIDDQPIGEPASFDNGTHTCLFFTYLHSAHRIEIVGFSANPEAQYMTVIILLVLVTMAAVFLSRKEFSHKRPPSPIRSYKFR